MNPHRQTCLFRSFQRGDNLERCQTKQVGQKKQSRRDSISQQYHESSGQPRHTLRYNGHTEPVLSATVDTVALPSVGYYTGHYFPRTSLPVNVWIDITVFKSHI